MDTNSNAKYIQTYKSLKADIYNNYKDGDFLPTEQELMQQYQVSRTTLRHAIQLLRKDGILDVKQGLGTRVLLQKEPNGAFILFHNVTNATHFFPNASNDSDTMVKGGIIDIIPAPPHIAEALNLEDGTKVYRLERLITRNEQPMMLCRNFFRCDLFPGLDEYSGKIEYMYNIYSFFEWKYNIVFSSGRQLISTQLASFFDARILNVEPGAPLLLFNRTSQTGNQIFEYTEWLANPELLNILITMEGPRKRTPMPMQRS
ncbi:MAG: GntR family transcriptional regulator [Clostridia bacterium]|nr:GntR family transcriptional regulator [Clostridia bacterium]